MDAESVGDGGSVGSGGTISPARERCHAGEAGSGNGDASVVVEGEECLSPRQCR